MSVIASKYWSLHKTPSDINEHLPAIANLAACCRSVFETGVRGVVSSYAIAHGLMYNGFEEKTHVLNDIDDCPVDEFLRATRGTMVRASFIRKSNLLLELGRNFDMTFIDTLHVYGQLAKELAKFAPSTNKFILMHDTSIDAEYGEAVRLSLDVRALSNSSGHTIAELSLGLRPAIEEFLRGQHDWVIVKQFTNNNGLTILARKEYYAEAMRAIAFINFTSTTTVGVARQ